jgi:hypothetical protein
MKVLLEINDKKAKSLLDVLKSLPFIKVKLLSAEKAKFFEELREAVEEVTLGKKGQKKARNAEDFRNEL